MVSVTPGAASELRSLLRHSRSAPGRAVRLVPNGHDGIGMSIDAPHEGDTVVEDAVGPVLIINGRLATALAGLVFDWVRVEVDGERRMHFTFRRPTEGEAGQEP